MAETSPAGWLLTVNDWHAIRKDRDSDEYISIHERVDTFYAIGSLTHALLALKLYERMFMRRYPMSAITLRLLSFAPIPADTELVALEDVGSRNLDDAIENLREELKDG